MSIIDRIAEDHSYLIDNKDFLVDGHDARLILSKTIDETFLSKKAFFVPSRIMQNADLDVHQDDDTKEFWQVKKGNIVRIVPKQIKG